MELEKVIEEMKAQGADIEQILKSLSQMVEEEKLTPEDLEKAKKLLGVEEPNEEKEKAKAEELFGIKLI